MKKLNKPKFEVGENVLIVERGLVAKVLECQPLPTNNEWLYTLKKDPWKVFGYVVTAGSAQIICLERELEKV